MIAQGFTQVEGLDFNETFAPITKFSSFHTILILAAEHNLEFHKMDVKAAYLNGVLKGEIYMEPLPGLEVPEGMVSTSSRQFTAQSREAGYGTLI